MRRAVLLFACVIGSAMGLFAEGPGATPDASAAYVPTMTFDVASIRQSKPDLSHGFTIGGGFKPIDSGHWVLQNSQIEHLLERAYPLGGGRRLEGLRDLPLAMRYAYFNVEAKADVEANERLAKLSQKDRLLEQGHMMQVLLAQRFNLKVHWETRYGETYNLVVSKAGRLHSTGAAPTAQEITYWGERGVPPIYPRYGRDESEYFAHGASTSDIAESLGKTLGKPVVDKTGLTGKYDFSFKYYRQFDNQPNDDDTNPLPSLDSAFQDELGLKIVPSHGPVQVLVIDHVEMPSAN